MDSENKQRVSFYLDRDLIQRADAYQVAAGCKSRNEFTAAALENYIADMTIKERGDALCEKLAAAIERAVDFEAVKISKGLFRYTVELDVIVQMLFVLNWRPDLDPDCFIEYRGVFYNVTRVDTFEGL